MTLKNSLSFLFLLTIVSCASNKAFSQDLKYAIAIQKMYEDSGCIDKYLFEQAEKTYMMLLNRDSINADINCRLGKLYYNRAVRYIKSKNVDKLSKDELTNAVNFTETELKKSVKFLEYCD